MSKEILILDYDPISHEDISKTLQLILKNKAPKFTATSCIESFKAIVSSTRWDVVIVNFYAEIFWDMGKEDLENFILVTKQSLCPDCVFAGVTSDDYQRQRLEKFGLATIYKVYDQQQIKNLLGVTDKALTMVEIEKVTCDHFKVPPAYLHKKSRRREYVKARQVTMYLAKIFTKYSLKAIGDFFDRDHTTVIHSCQTVVDLMDTELEFKLKVMELKEQILFSQ